MFIQFCKTILAAMTKYTYLAVILMKLTAQNYLLPCYNRLLFQSALHATVRADLEAWER